jgi:hypothetical protein
MAAKKVERKTTADGDTWIRVVKPCRAVRMSNLHAVTSETGGLVDSGANTSLQGEDMQILHQEHGSVAVIGPSNGVEASMDNLPLRNYFCWQEPRYQVALCEESYVKNQLLRCFGNCCYVFSIH